MVNKIYTLRLKFMLCLKANRYIYVCFSVYTPHLNNQNHIVISVNADIQYIVTVEVDVSEVILFKEVELSAASISPLQIDNTTTINGFNITAGKLFVWHLTMEVASNMTMQ